jgi:hypothetical protein
MSQFVKLKSVQISNKVLIHTHTPKTNETQNTKQCYIFWNRIHKGEQIQTLVRAPFSILSTSQNTIQMTRFNVAYNLNTYFITMQCSVTMSSTFRLLRGLPSRAVPAGSLHPVSSYRRLPPHTTSPSTVQKQINSILYELIQQPGQLSRYSDERWTAGFDSRWRQDILSFSTASRTALGPTQPPIQWVLGALSLGDKASGAWSSPFSSI